MPIVGTRDKRRIIHRFYDQIPTTNIYKNTIY